MGLYLPIRENINLNLYSRRCIIQENLSSLLKGAVLKLQELLLDRRRGSLSCYNEVDVLQHWVSIDLAKHCAKLTYFCCAVSGVILPQREASNDGNTCLGKLWD